MRVRTLAERTTQKNQKTRFPVAIAVELASPTVFALTVDFTMERR